MGFDDLPKVRQRKWIGDAASKAPRTLVKARHLANFVRSMNGVTHVKIVKETRWRVLWRQL